MCKARPYAPPAPVSPSLHVAFAPPCRCSWIPAPNAPLPSPVRLPLPHMPPCPAPIQTSCPSHSSFTPFACRGAHPSTVAFSSMLVDPPSRRVALLSVEVRAYTPSLSSPVQSPCLSALCHPQVSARAPRPTTRLEPHARVPDHPPGAVFILDHHYVPLAETR